MCPFNYGEIVHNNCKILSIELPDTPTKSAIFNKVYQDDCFQTKIYLYWI